MAEMLTLQHTIDPAQIQYMDNHGTGQNTQQYPVRQVPASENNALLDQHHQQSHEGKDGDSHIQAGQFELLEAHLGDFILLNAPTHHHRILIGLREGSSIDYNPLMRE